jgi:hypothetical protein
MTESGGVNDATGGSVHDIYCLSPRGEVHDIVINYEWVIRC